MKKYLPAVLFFGGLWGISEATVGFLAHLLLPGMGWMFYFPLAYGFMRGAYRQTGKSSVVLACAILCAAIKLLNLPMAPRPDYVINPAVSIVLEGLTAGLAFYWIMEKKPLIRYGLMPFLTSAVWRGLYLIYLLVAPGWIREISVLYQPDKLLSFATLEIMGNGLMIALGSLGISLLARYFRIPLQPWTNRQGLFRRSYGVLSFMSVSLAVILQWVF